MPPSDLADDAERVKSRDKAAISRALNLVEDRRSESQQRVASLLAALKSAPLAIGGHRVGIIIVFRSARSKQPVEQFGYGDREDGIDVIP